MPPDPNARNVFQEMQTDLVPVEDPGYLQYWEMRGASEEDARVEQIVRDLTRIAIRGGTGRAEYIDREPSLQARYWYRALGPLNPMVDVEPDLVKAASMMYGKEIKHPTENASLRLDSAYALADLARITANPDTSKEALRLSLGVVQDIKNDEKFMEKPASYRLQTLLLEGDLWHDAVRLQHTGSLNPTELRGEAYRNFERAFVSQELKNIEAFGDQIRSGVTDENAGIVFEWFFVMLARHKAWADETVDTTAVRGATSRENAEWTGEDELNPARVTGNHDVVITNSRGDAIDTDRWQLNLPGSLRRRFHPSIKIMNFEQALGIPFHNIDQATGHMTRNLLAYRADYRGEQP